MDESDFDIITCPLEDNGCPYYHLMLTEGYKTKKEAEINMKMLIKTYNEKKELPSTETVAHETILGDKIEEYKNRSKKK